MSLAWLVLTWLPLAWLAVAAAAKRPTHHENVFKAGDPIELRVFLSPSRAMFTAFNKTEALLWHDPNLTYSADAATITKDVKVPLSYAKLLANGTAFVHIFVTKAGSSPDSKRDSYDRWATTSTVFELTAFSERLQPRGLFNLLSGEPAPWEAELRRGLAEASAAGRPEGEFISYWKPKVHAQLLIDTEPYELGQMPPLLQHYLHNMRLLSGHKFRPLVYINELTTMKIHWVAINSSVALPESSLPLELSYSPLPTKRFQWMVNLQHSFKMNEETLGISEKESEDMRGMFVHTNPVLLYTTVGVSAVRRCSSTVHGLLRPSADRSRPSTGFPPTSRAALRWRLPPSLPLTSHRPPLTSHRPSRCTCSSTCSPSRTTSRSGRRSTLWRGSPLARSRSTG